MNTQPDPEHPARHHDPQPALPRIPLGLSPTPPHQLTGPMSAFGDGPELLATREDPCGIAAGQRADPVPGAAGPHRLTITAGDGHTGAAEQVRLAAARHTHGAASISASRVRVAPRGTDQWPHATHLRNGPEQADLHPRLHHGPAAGDHADSAFGSRLTAGGTGTRSRSVITIGAASWPPACNRDGRQQGSAHMRMPCGICLTPWSCPQWFVRRLGAEVPLSG